jgi:hypothetical protein
VTDQAGRFARGAAPGMETGMSYGEEHHLKREIEHAAIEHMAQRIEYTLAAEAFPPWILAAPSEIAKDILAALSSAATAKLLGQQTADLTRVPLSDLEARFLSKP